MSNLLFLYFEEKPEHLEPVTHQCKENQNGQNDTASPEDQHCCLPILTQKISADPGDDEKPDEFVHNYLLLLNEHNAWARMLKTITENGSKVNYGDTPFLLG